MEEVKDVIAEETATESSSEEQPPVEETESSSEDVNAPAESTEEPKVPLSRLNKEIDKRKALEELMSAYQRETTSTSKVEEPSSAEAWQKYIREQSEQSAKAVREDLLRDIELREVMTDPEFALYESQMKSEITRNKSLSPRDAFLLAKAKNPIAQNKIKQQIEAEIRNELKSKQKANVGTSQARVPKKSVDSSLIYEKGSDGKFKYSLKELEEIIGGK